MIKILGYNFHQWNENNKEKDLKVKIVSRKIHKEKKCKINLY